MTLTATALKFTNPVFSTLELQLGEPALPVWRRTKGRVRIQPPRGATNPSARACDGKIKHAALGCAVGGLVHQPEVVARLGKVDRDRLANVGRVSRAPNTLSTPSITFSKQVGQGSP